MNSDKKMSIAMILIVISVFILFSKLIVPTPVQVIIQGDSAFIKQIPNVYTLADVIIITVFATLLGISATYLLGRESEAVPDMPVTETIGSDGELATPKEYQIENIMSILKGNEPKVITELLDSGEMNQAELAARIGIPKSTLSRTLQDLERRKLIIRYENGMSKMVKLADSLRKDR
jgi:DNA-binding transcriptional ArsR family regulator